MTFVKLEVALAMLEEHKLPEDSPYSDDRAMAGSYNLAIENAIEALRSLPTDDGVTDEMVERAARAICESTEADVFDELPKRSIYRAAYIQQARAALQAALGPLPAPPSD